MKRVISLFLMLLMVIPCAAVTAELQSAQVEETLYRSLDPAEEKYLAFDQIVKSENLQAEISQTGKFVKLQFADGCEQAKLTISFQGDPDTLIWDARWGTVDVNMLLTCENEENLMPAVSVAAFGMQVENSAVEVSRWVGESTDAQFTQGNNQIGRKFNVFAKETEHLDAANKEMQVTFENPDAFSNLTVYLSVPFRQDVVGTVVADLNYDHKTDAKDALILRLYIARHLKTPDGKPYDDAFIRQSGFLNNADLTRDWKINSKDSHALRRMIVESE